jgi:hypothetical protein
MASTSILNDYNPALMSGMSLKGPIRYFYSAERPIILL